MILATSTVSTFVKYIFYVSDMLMEGQWEKKAVYTFYLVRELYVTFRNFRIRIADYVRYRKITSNMNERFPDATSEELDVSDATCIICREEMATAKKLLDGHLFHVHCLRSWLEHQHTCPTCRAPIIPAAWDLSIFLVVNHDHCISTEKQENRLKKRFLYGFSMGASAPQEGFSLLGRCRAACPNVQGLLYINNQQ
ncbi:ERAD-associated E3 ubiquitin-protein ligase HRD1A [Zea mays]|uniref:RING-type E3 ubiquitin transferase n=1 Tax=Zea mays TaxID=4577 RepID=A0A1D6NTX0_MAIZE|nr:ERAD-associated E3 ubiquitin-protein ligase HRD1A [Zea mays]|eukprot:XP_020399201.1 uncharacterized LOC100279006 isoform X1 [Zea mays]